MTTRLAFLAVLIPLALPAQVVLVSLDGITERPVDPDKGYNYGEVAAGDSKDVRFHARNLGSAPVIITNHTVTNITGAGFSIVNTSSTPFTVAPGDVMAIFVRFVATPLGNYSAILQVTYCNTISDSQSGLQCDPAQPRITVSANLQATVVPAPTITVGAPCTGPDATRTINFGRSQQFVKVTCTATVQNPGAQPLLISLAPSVPPNGFTASFGTSFSIAAGQTGSLILTFNAPAALVYSAALTVGARTYTLFGVGFSAALPAAVWTFDTTTFSSAQQHTLSVALAGPSPVAASGSLTLTFSSAVSTVADDAAIQFVATSKRIATFTVKAGDTAILLNGQPNIVFSTGTTAGQIAFRIDPGAFGIAGDPATAINIGSAPIAVTASSATRIVNNLQVVVSGFDNTYTIGPMSFTFYGRNGGVIGGAIQGDFSSNFRTFYQGQTLGSSFLMRLTFPVTGDATIIGGVEATLNNTVGAAHTQRITFP